VPTHDETGAFLSGYESLTPQQRDRFDRKREEFVADLIAMERGSRQGFRLGLRVKRVQGKSGLFEMTWAPEGRALFSMGEPVVTGKRHIVWHRVGDHSILPRHNTSLAAENPTGRAGTVGRLGRSPTGSRSLPPSESEPMRRWVRYGAAMSRT